MNAMAVNYAVYSNRMKGLAPYLYDYNIYIYVNATNLVLVCVDCNKHTQKQHYEETQNIDMMIYKPGCEPRVSTVWKLKQTMDIIYNRLQKSNAGLKVYGILLTEDAINNANELADYWEKNNIKVIDDFSHLKLRKADVNADDDLAGKVYFSIAMDESLDAQPEPKDETEDEEFNEFEKTLYDFVNTQLDEDVDSVTDQITNDSADNDAEESYDKEPTPQELETPSSKSETIEQNLGLSVDIEILEPIDNPREELDKLIGCDDIKRRMDELVALTTYNKTMQELFPNSKQHEVSLHSVFLGRPGTGKTTVCKIFGSLLHQAGALSKGHVVLCDRGTFIGTLWGDEERSVRQVLEKAKGGVLMIDEAYLLNGKNENDPGKLVLQLLMNILADETQRDIAVVLCGYKDQMQKLLETNPGLQSRFPNKFEFQDFSVDELLEITQTRIRDYEYSFTEQAWEKYRGILNQAYQVRDPQTWGNARFVANQLERIYMQHATRCVIQKPEDKQDWRQLTPEDIVPIEVARPKVKIGF
jgi:SpoVK/Ycf46/Vps4 family AAA+-type ATPase